MTKLEENFIKFHDKNPHVYQKLTALAKQLKRKGINQYSIKGLFEVLRWHTAIKTQDKTFKLCNNYTAYYSRLIMDNNPDLKGFFKIKKLRRE